MSKKIIQFLPLFAMAMILGCSDEETSPIGPDISENPLNPIDPNNPFDPNLNPVNPEFPFSSSSFLGNGVPLSSSSLGSVFSSSSQNIPSYVSSSSYAMPATQSSSSFKEYKDNNLAKESYLPAAGFYSNLTIQPLTPKKGGQIKCTFDGSLPTQNSESITSARQISKNTVVRCSEFVNEQAADTTTQTYFINESMTMPVVSISVDPVKMFDTQNGYYDNDGWAPEGAIPNSGNNNQNNNQNNDWNNNDWNNNGNQNNDWNNNGNWNGGNQGFGVGDWGAGGGFGGGFPDMGGDWGGGFPGGFGGIGAPCPGHNYCDESIELPVHVEYFENGSSTKTKNWEIDGGLKISGQYSRKEKKKSVTITLRDDYQSTGRLKYSLYKTRPEAKKFKSFVLRNNGNRFGHDYIEDAMLSSLLEGSGVDYQRSRQVVVFYNGVFFGIHDMREKLNRHFVETNYGIDSKDINVIKLPKGGKDAIEASGDDGDKSEYMRLVSMIASGNFAGANNQNYAQVQNYLDVNNFARYIAAEIYYHNADWPNNNVRAWGAPSKGYPFKYMVHDLDHGFGYQYAVDNNVSGNMFQWIKQGGGMSNGACTGEGCIAQIYNKLIENPDFKRAFLNHSSIMLNYYLTKERVDAQTDAMTRTIGNSEMERDIQLYSHNNVDRTGANLKNYANSRTQTVKQEYQQEFGLNGSEIQVTIAANGNGTVYLEGMPLPTANYRGQFFAGNSMLLEAVPASGAMFSSWSDGSTENPRIVQINGATTITAQFK
ncbi:MAG: CotH kinase family protein [Fibrobacter sp.]|nr:CotH kinase family protein [Fibrobacter sp.]